MFLLFLASVFLTISMFSPEQIVTTVAGAMFTYGFTNWVKTRAGWAGAGATILTFAIAFAAALASVAVAAFLSGEPLTWEMIPNASFQIFTLATVAYKLITADFEPTEPTATAPSF